MNVRHMAKVLDFLRRVPAEVLLDSCNECCFSTDAQSTWSQTLACAMELEKRGFPLLLVAVSFVWLKQNEWP